MPVPLGVVIPAAAAGLAYLNVKTALWYDLDLLRGVVPAILCDFWREKRDRANAFYKLESRAKSSSSANRTYLMFQDRTWTYAQTYEMVLRYGNWLLKKFDLKKDDIVAMDMTNSDHYILLCFGLWSIGVKPAFINYNLASKSLVHCVQAADAVMMLVDPAVQQNIDDEVRAALGKLRIEYMTEEYMAEIMATEPVHLPDSLRAGDLGRSMAALIYTSGTTGLPKAAVISWSKMTRAGQMVSNLIGTRPTDIFYTCMPLYHSSATIMGFAHMLEAGAAFAIGKRFSTKTFWKDCRAYNATIIQYVGETCRYLVSAPSEFDPETGENLDKKHHVRMAFGNGLRPDIWEEFRERFGIETIVEFYAATEGFLGTWNVSKNKYTTGVIGRNGVCYGIAMWVRMAIVEVDHDTDNPIRDPKTGLCHQAPRGQVGELMFIIYRPDDLTSDYQGYYHNKEASEKKIVRNVLRKGDAYFRTGDLVSWDWYGRMYFHDRIGDTFRWKSENVATTEVSQMMGLHPAIQEANVYGVRLPNHDGRAGCAAIVLKEESSDALMKSLADHAKKTLPKYAVPIFLRVSENMHSELTSTNKHQKHNLRTQGVDPDKVGKDEMWWLHNGRYVPFRKTDWQRICGGEVKL